MKPTRAMLDRWAADPVAFAEEACVPRGCQPGRWQLSDYQRDVLRRILAPDAPTTCALIWPKRSGKTVLASIVAIHVALFGGVDRQIVYLSTSERNATTALYAETRYILEHSPALAGVAEVQNTRATFTPTGSTIATVANTVGSVAGIGIALLISDELWCADEAAFHMAASQTLGGRVLLISQAAGLDSYVKTLHDLHERGEGGPDLWVDRFVPTPELPSPNPAVTAQWLDERKRTLPAPLYRAYFENEWLSGAESVWTPEQLAGCVTEQIALPRTAAEWAALRDEWGGTWTVGAGLDRALPYSKHGDRTVLAVAARRRFELDEAALEEVWILGLDVMRHGTREEVVAAVERANATFGPHRRHFETYNAGDLAPSLGAELIHPGSGQQAAMFDVLYRLAAEGRLVIPAECERLVAEMGSFGCSMPQGSSLPKWGGLGKANDDTVYAVGHATMAALAGRGSSVFSIPSYNKEPMSQPVTYPGLSPDIRAGIGGRW